MMKHRPTLIVALTILAWTAAVSNAASVTYQSNDPGSASWFAGNAPVAGDLAESATVTLVQGTTHSMSGSLALLTNGSGGAGTTSTSWFSNGQLTGVDKVQIDFGSPAVEDHVCCGP